MNPTLLAVTSATESIGHGNKRRVLINTCMDHAILTCDQITGAALLQLIDGFETRLFQAMKSLLKAPRQEVLNSRNSRCINLLQPYYFSGGPVRDPSGIIRHVFDIANSRILRSAAGLSGMSNRDDDYAACSNAKLLELPFEEKQRIIDKALEHNWNDLQKAIKPTAKRYG